MLLPMSSSKFPLTGGAGSLKVRLTNSGSVYSVFIVIIAAYIILHTGGVNQPIETVCAEDCRELFPESVVFLDEIGIDNFTSTGMTFDEADDAFWIADHGSSAEDEVRLIELDASMEHILSIIQISNYKNDGNINLQGIAYDKLDDAIWIAVGDRIQQITKTGEINKTIYLGKYENCSANGICVDESDGTLWVLFYKDYLLHFDRDGKTIEVVQVNMADQDMIFMYDGLIYISVGADYLGKENYCAVFDPETKEIIIKYRLNQSYAVEGIYIDNNRLYVINDGAYHNAAIPRTYIVLYYLEEV